MVQDDITFQREIFEPIDQIDHVHPVALVNVQRDISIGQKRPAWAHQTLQEEEGHETPCGTY
jgi:hypothetical protein